jgi:hypothetical protein
MRMHSYLYILLSLLIVIETPALGMKRFFAVTPRTPLSLKNNRAFATTAQEQASHQNNELIVSPYPFTYSQRRREYVVENYEQAGPRVHEGLMHMHDLRRKINECEREGKEEERLGHVISHTRVVNFLLLFECPKLTKAIELREALSK